MENHYWHLCGSMVLFALFTSLVSEEEKQNMVQKLLSLEKPMSIKFGTPKFPEKVGVDTLSDLVTAESWWLFDCSKNDPEFLSLSVEEWKTDDQFMEAEKFIKTLKCTNPGVDKATLNKGCDRL